MNMHTCWLKLGLLAAFVGLIGSAARGETLNKEGEWTKTLSVSRGNSLVCWAKDVREEQSLMLSMEGTYKYKEEGETYEDFVFETESTDRLNSSGGYDPYLVFRASEWEYIPSTVKSISFKVTAMGWYDEAVPANNKFSFGSSKNESDYPGEEEPIVVDPKGSATNPMLITPKETSTPATGATMTDCELGEESGTTYYLKTSTLLAGHKYFFGIDNGSDLFIGTSNQGENLFQDTSCSKPYESWELCSEAYSFVPPANGVYYLKVNTESDFNFYSAALPAWTPAQHASTELDVGETSEPFAPGYLCDPEGTSYDSIIDQELFMVPDCTKGRSYVFSTDGATADLLMRVYDAKGNVLAENLRTGDSSCEVRCVWTAPAAYNAKNNAIYVGVCQQLEDGEEPSAGEVTLTVSEVEPVTSLENIVATPSGMVEKPSSPNSLSSVAWVNTFVLAARAGVTYKVTSAATDEAANGLELACRVYTLNGTKATEFTPTKGGLSGNIDRKGDGIEFTPTEHGTVYVDVFVADGAWGSGKGLDYGPYTVTAKTGSGAYGVLTVGLFGAPQSLMGWKLLEYSADGKTGWKVIQKPAEVVYPSGASTVLPVGFYKVRAENAAGFVDPDQKEGFAVVGITANLSTTAGYMYCDKYDPADDGLSGSYYDKSAKKTVKYAPVDIKPSAKVTTLARSLWTNDTNDWYTFTAAEGSYYKFAFAEKTGTPVVRVYTVKSGVKTVTSEKDLVECTYVLADDPDKAVQVCATAKEAYYVRVTHAEDSAKDWQDSAYTLAVSSATPGTIKVEKSALSVKEDAAYVDVNVTRTAKDGLVKVKFRTMAGTAKPGTEYYPTNGVLVWKNGENAKQTVRVRLIPDEIPTWEEDKKFKVYFETYEAEYKSGEYEVASDEYFPAFATDTKTKLPVDSCEITLTEVTKKVPGTIQAVCVTPKKPVFEVEAGKSVDIPFERVSGADGTVGVKFELTKGTSSDFEPCTVTKVWKHHEADEYVVRVTAKDAAVAGKNFTLKLTALTSAKTDEVQYDKPTLAAASVTVNVTGGGSGTQSVTDYMKDKAVAAALKAQGVTGLKESKAATWTIDADGKLASTEKADLTFSLTGPGRFTYKLSGEGEDRVEYIASGSKTLVVKGPATIERWTYKMLSAAVAAAPTVDKAVLLPGENELVFVREEGLSYRVYLLSAGAKDGKTTLKLGDAQTEIKPDKDGSYRAAFVFDATNKGKYTWRVDSFFEGGSVTNVAKTAWNLAVADLAKLPAGAEAPQTAVTGADAWGDPLNGAVGGAEVVLYQGVKAEFEIGTPGSTVKLAGGKLPDGVKLEQDKATKQWYLRGTPTKAGAYQPMFQETAAYKTVQVAGSTTALDVMVESAGTSIGTFNGLATTYDATNAVASLASVQFTSAAGKLSAKVSIAGKSYTFADTGFRSMEGSQDDPEDPPMLTAELIQLQKITYKDEKKKTVNATVTNLLVVTVCDLPETNADSWYLDAAIEIYLAALPDASGTGYQEDVWYEGRLVRDNAKVASWVSAAAAYAGYYTVSLANPDAQPGEPQGHGYLTATVDAKGKVKVAGVLADGTSYSSSSTAVLAKEGEAGSFAVPLYYCKGTVVFGGWLKFTLNAEETPVASLDWSQLAWKNDDPAATEAGEYGFDLALYPVGGWYDTVFNLQRHYLEYDFSVDLPKGEADLENLAAYLPEGYSFVATPQGEPVTVTGDALSVAKQVLVKDADKLVNYAASVNPANVTFTFKRATGIVTGTFDLPYEGLNTKGAREQKSYAKLKHQGVLLLSRSDDGYLEDDVWTSGFYQGPTQTITEQVGSKKVTRKWTGSYRFDIKATKIDRDWTEAED